ncbi:uncharacterized protein LOC117777094 [Hippoglossus hippoglossus]|uniref:uncharacterized protein LOC117777094 n=1 Tax=Hippoglossus hippoglossus TaxID=8267 RepID=UPI00148B39C4|nr:uncharacterized protein LOC117777094 [Hippoglossus hippoglossus]
MSEALLNCAAQFLRFPKAMKCFILVVVGLLLSPQQAHSARDDRPNCKPVTASFCQDVGYTTTLNPTGVTGYSLQQIGQIVETACSPAVATLMCRIVVPECSSADDSRVKPCRALCDKVKTDCESVIRAKRLSWPTRLRCEALPESNCVQGLQPRVSPTSPATCQTISSTFCSDLLYTETILPNLLGHTTQEEANLEVHQFLPLVRVGCSPHLKPFLCSLYTPQCVAGKARPPCRTDCEQARSGCESLMNKFNFVWPENFICNTMTTESCEQGQDSVDAQTSLATCQTITVPLCNDLPYTDTALPNVFGHKTQQEADMELQQFYPLVKVRCSPHLKPFLCSVYTPECVAGKVRPPCRTLCEQARSGCESLMNRFGFTWPAKLGCEAFTMESCEHYGVSSSGGICEPITIPMCQGLSYNQTISPNLLGHTSQREAVMKMSFFNSIVQTVCSVDIRLFLCRVYAPQCVAGEVQRPCRSFCERAKRGCESLMNSFGVSWPADLQCNLFPEEVCISEDSRSEMLNAEAVLTKLNAGGFTVRGKSLSLKTARLLLTLMDSDNTGDLDVLELFKLEHYVAIIRREYVESYESRNPSSVTQTQMEKALSVHDFSLDDGTFRTLWREHGSRGGIDYDEYVALLTRLQILRGRFKAHLLSLPCDCQVASFSFKQFLKSAII